MIIYDNEWKEILHIIKIYKNYLYEKIIKLERSLKVKCDIDEFSDSAKNDRAIKLLEFRKILTNVDNLYKKVKVHVDFGEKFRIVKKHRKKSNTWSNEELWCLDILSKFRPVEEISKLLDRSENTIKRMINK